MSAPLRTHRRELPVPPEAAAAAVEAELPHWGGSWQRQGLAGAFELPVQAGLRHGLLRGRLEAAPHPHGATVQVAVEEEIWRLHRPAAALLAAAAAAAVAGVLWPFFPWLAGLLPLALVLSLGAWFLVLTRLRHHGAEELLGAVEAATREPAP
ncbi:MAG TPA: hypothetical protein VMT16_07125 [Thermoanaerobaculia bacterium]|nr:hypothetical protein [Thermoanaerobaculia bacterium]